MTITVKRTDDRTLVLTVEADAYEEGDLADLERLVSCGRPARLMGWTIWEDDDPDECQNREDDFLADVNEQ